MSGRLETGIVNGVLALTLLGSAGIAATASEQSSTESAAAPAREEPGLQPQRGVQIVNEGGSGSADTNCVPASCVGVVRDETNGFCEVGEETVRWGYVQTVPNNVARDETWPAGNGVTFTKRCEPATRDRSKCTYAWEGPRCDR